MDHGLVASRSQQRTLKESGTNSFTVARFTIIKSTETELSEIFIFFVGHYRWAQRKEKTKSRKVDRTCAINPLASATDVPRGVKILRTGTNIRHRTRKNLY
jgi:hypothetical protein